jgi:hypothetical protein
MATQHYIKPDVGIISTDGAWSKSRDSDGRIVLSLTTDGGTAVINLPGGVDPQKHPRSGTLKAGTKITYDPATKCCEVEEVTL